MKKLVSLVLALVMLLSLAPAAFAREAEGGRNFYDYHDYSQFPLGDGSDSAENTISVAVRSDPTYSADAWGYLVLAVDETGERPELRH